MLIRFVEVSNFRRLKSVRVDFSERTTLLVGANNSGKTSAMIALSHFLVDSSRFTTNDFPLSCWPAINAIGSQWVAGGAGTAVQSTQASDWDVLLPSLDVWIAVDNDEIHHVRHLLPTLDWAGGLLGVRLRYEPKDTLELRKEYLDAAEAAKATREAADERGGLVRPYTLQLWPANLRDFLDRRLRNTFAPRAYLLDPAKQNRPVDGVARPQVLPIGAEPIEGNPLEGLIQIDEIAAQRGLSDTVGRRDADGSGNSRERNRLSEQLRAYYAKHLDPSESPEPADLNAMQAIEDAQLAFNQQLEIGFSAALQEVAKLNYPGVVEPKITISTKIRPSDSMNHEAAVQYEVRARSHEPPREFRLPEQYNGLGFQNLLLIVFRLMGFRDGWMRVGKAGTRFRGAEADAYFPPPLHLVLVEEPEAHLHAQVQQVFIRKAYEILRHHSALHDANILRTQLIVSTHSSHIAHEVPFADLRYFRRLPAMLEGEVPTSTVINLSEVFGSLSDTERFVTRYLRAVHCDLFFADAAILVEGPAERILVPHFIRTHFRVLDQCYLTLLEIGGSHAHRLRQLIEHLGLLTLVITDIDSGVAGGGADQTRRGVGQITANATLKLWHPALEGIDPLLDLDETAKTKAYSTPQFAVRVAYQAPIQITMNQESSPSEALARTFEDALVFTNVAIFRSLEGDGMIRRIREAVAANRTPESLAAAMFEILKTGDKAAFALDLIWMRDPESLVVPQYIADGLAWLQTQLTTRQAEVLTDDSEPAIGPAP